MKYTVKARKEKEREKKEEKKKIMHGNNFVC